ncbi:hypothetical protein NUW58_g2149 [Xylaria curta]|uniref:Uncharacterized protein n=1 Tax=Xylaria curta TaxID=42375 RepID=A0ACC1PIK7_9PEZI|nr:hypothetical protein NUW58_g2149 [Xylaria curta]
MFAPLLPPLLPPYWGCLSGFARLVIYANSQNDEGRGSDANEPSAPSPPKQLTREDYTVGWLAMSYIDQAAAIAMLDETHSQLEMDPGNIRNYRYGEIGGHNIVITSLDWEGCKATNAASIADDVYHTFPSLRMMFMVGVASGVPGDVDVRLGDVVVGTSVIEYVGLSAYPDEDSIGITGVSVIPPMLLRWGIQEMEALDEMDPHQVPSIIRRTVHEIGQKNPHIQQYSCRDSLQDLLFESTYKHTKPGKACDECDRSHLVERTPREDDCPVIHYGRIGTSSTIVENAGLRDKLAQLKPALCLESGNGRAIDFFKALMVCSIGDYADSHKNPEWEQYAAATAAAYTKVYLGQLPLSLTKTIES